MLALGAHAEACDRKLCPSVHALTARYCPMVRTTLPAGRVLFDDSLSCCLTIANQPERSAVDILIVEDRRRQLVVNNDVEQLAGQAVDVTSRRTASGRRRVIRSCSISIFAGARVWA